MTVTFDKAKTLLAESPCYTPDDVERALGVTYAPEQRIALENIPFSEVVLRECAGTHMLFPGFPLSMLELREKFVELFYTKSGGWYAGVRETFSRTQLPVRWHLLRMDPVPYSLNKTWNEQCKLLLPEEEVPSSALVIYASMLHFGASKQRLFEHCYVRTSDVDSGGSHVDVGVFDYFGFGVFRSDWCDDRSDALRLASARKSS